jgi:hypothetical protein
LFSFYSVSRLRELSFTSRTLSNALFTGLFNMDHSHQANAPGCIANLVVPASHTAALEQAGKRILRLRKMPFLCSWAITALCDMSNFEQIR